MDQVCEHTLDWPSVLDSITIVFKNVFIQDKISCDEKRILQFTQIFITVPNQVRHLPTNVTLLF